MPDKRIANESAKVRRKLTELEEARAQAAAAGNLAKSSDIERRIAQKQVELETLDKIRDAEPLK